jgi:hypothetical protein
MAIAIKEFKKQGYKIIKKKDWQEIEPILKDALDEFEKGWTYDSACLDIKIKKVKAILEENNGGLK